MAEWWKPGKKNEKETMQINHAILFFFNNNNNINNNVAISEFQMILYVYVGYILWFFSRLEMAEGFHCMYSVSAHNNTTMR